MSNKGRPGQKKFRWSEDALRMAERIAGTCQTMEQVAERMTAETGEFVTKFAVQNRYKRLMGGRSLMDFMGRANPLQQPPSLTLGVPQWEEDDDPTSEYRPGLPEAPRTQPVMEPVSPSDVRTSSPAAADEALYEKLFKLSGRRPTTLEEACDALQSHPAKVRELVERARDAGYRIELSAGQIGVRPSETPLEEQVVEIDQPGEEHTVALVGDIHFGNKHHLGAQFRDFCDRAYARGVREFLHVGDLIDGNYRHSVWEQTARGFDEQVAVAIRDLPAYEGARWHWIQGNHDETAGEHAGMDVGKRLTAEFRQAGRDDLVYHGARGAYLRLRAPQERRGLLVELWHPRDKSNAYALSYRLQKHVEKYAPGQKADVCAAGHWHQQMYFTTRGVHCFSCGCWQGGQSSFGKSLGGAPSIGSWIVDYALTAGGTVRFVRPEWVAYYEQETVREVGLG